AGGQQPFTYAAGSGPYRHADHITGLPVGTHVIHIKDANNCIKDSTVVLNQPDKLEADITMFQSVCSPLATGSISITARGGTVPYIYALGESGYSNKKIYTSLASGQYRVRVQDEHNCTLDTTVFL